MIALQGVSKVYQTVDGPKKILEDVSITFPTDRNVGILGLNGTGKSTLMRLIARAEAPTKGRVVTTGRISWPLAFSGGFQGSLSAIDNIRFVSRIYGMNWWDVVDAVEAFAELGTYLKMPVKTLSSGMRARLSLGLSLAIRFDVYLIDEIPGVGDTRFKKRFEDAFSRLKDESTLFLASHNPAIIRKHCDMALVLSHGKLTAYDDVNQALEVYGRA